MVKNDICLRVHAKKNALFQKMCPKKAFIPLMSRIGSDYTRYITYAKILAEYIALLYVPYFLKS